MGSKLEIPIDENYLEDGTLELSVTCRGRAPEGKGHAGKVFELSVRVTRDQRDLAKFPIVETMKERLRQAYRDHCAEMHKPI